MALYLVPTMMQRIWKLPDDVKFSYDLTSLERAFHLAEPCPPWLKEVWIEWIGAEALWELYGGTEGQSSTVLDGVEWLAHRGSVGRPQSGEMKICDEDGNDLIVIFGVPAGGGPGAMMKWAFLVMILLSRAHAVGACDVVRQQVVAAKWASWVVVDLKP